MIFVCLIKLCLDTPGYVIYHELILTSKEYMTQVTSIDPYWLGKLHLYFLCSVQDSPSCSAELGSVFYSVKEKNFDGSGNRRVADREFSRKAELEQKMKEAREHEA